MRLVAAAAGHVGGLWVVILFLTSAHVLAVGAVAQVGEERPVATENPTIEQRRFRLHVAVGHLDAFGGCPKGVADLQAQVPQRVQQRTRPVGQQFFGRAPGGHAFLKKQEIHVGLRTLFRSSVAAEGDQRDAWGDPL